MNLCLSFSYNIRQPPCDCYKISDRKTRKQASADGLTPIAFRLAEVAIGT